MDKNLCRLLKVHFCYKWTSQLYDRSPKLKTVWSAEEKQTKTSLLKRTKKWTKNCFLLGGLFKSKRITGYHSIFFFSSNLLLQSCTFTHADIWHLLSTTTCLSLENLKNKNACWLRGQWYGTAFTYLVLPFGLPGDSSQKSSGHKTTWLPGKEKETFIFSHVFLGDRTHTVIKSKTRIRSIDFFFWWPWTPRPSKFSGDVSFMYLIYS